MTEYMHTHLCVCNEGHDCSMPAASPCPLGVRVILEVLVSLVAPVR